ncbi:hypothetical protein CspeluHIS016_0302270 [Cutaneotrichosporon spelunceum]|uniref:HIG1 domain-containing protein n=1 Tax=Cutaneotrichosporon spelunceum TaxID=1672016 RepID=A0AAD3TT29_9TREE|nr:hypothetical protein CspeluHIS016_0302270 [Cutaneotrichosporon spelunceum]
MTDSGPDRGRRLEHQKRAYELQLIGGLKGMAWWTVYGLVGVGLLHRFNPTFRKQTWAIKAFLVTSSAIFGLCLGADEYLLKYEAGQRERENAIRREARNALAARGIIATETEIRRWKAERQAERDALAESAREALDNIEGAENVETGAIARLAKARNFGKEAQEAELQPQAVAAAASLDHVAVQAENAESEEK